MSALAISGHCQEVDAVYLLQFSFFIGAEKPHREPHYIAGKPNAWRWLGIREYCPDPRRRFGKVARHLYHSCAQRCWPVQRISGKVFLVLLQALEHVVCQHWHTATLFFEFFAAR